jgi:hypothetical protein
MRKLTFCFLQVALILFVSSLLLADEPRNIAGYDKTVWGMSEDEVLNAESPQAERLDKPVKTANGDIGSITIKEIEIASTKFRVLFIFDYESRKLRQVTLESVKDISPARTFSSIEKLLTEKYGPPTYKQEDKYKQENKNVSWKLTKTVIELLYVNIPLANWTQVFVIYKPVGASADASKNL